MSVRGRILPLLALVLACQEPLAEPAALPARAPGTTAAVAAFPACTKHWKNPVNGIWSFGVNWNPAGVPGAADVACIDAPGTYTVSTFLAPAAKAVIIGGTGAFPTLRYAGSPGQTWTATTGIDVRSGATLALDSSLTISAGYIEVGGTLSSGAVAVPRITADSLVNRGTLAINAASVTASPYPTITVLGPVGFRNTGTLSSCHFTLNLRNGSEAWMEGGRTTGNVDITVTGTTTILPPKPMSFVWSGGTLGTSVAPLTVKGINLRLTNTALQGLVTTSAAPFITGDVGPGVTLDVGGDPAPATTQPVTVLRNLQSGPMTNLGRLVLGGHSIIGGPDSVEIAGPGLLNAGDITLYVGTLAMDSLVNSGTVEVWADVPVTTPALLRNRGQISVASWGRLVIQSAEYLAEANSHQDGALVVDHGTLRGVGNVGDVTAVGGTIEPGGAYVSPTNPGIGTLTVESLTLDAASTVGFDLQGLATGAHDSLAVRLGITYGGTLSIRERLPFLGGSCGQVLSLISDGSGGAGRGAFATVTGLTPAPARGWRVYNPSGVLQLVGHDPSLPISLAPSQVSVLEGGPSSSYALCLRSAPVAGATVTVTPSTGGGQVVAPGAQVFGSLTWALPRTVTVTAVDDALVEASPHAATMTHAVTSTDPAYAGARPGSVTVSITDNDASTNLELHVFSAPPVVAVGASFTVTLQNENLGPNTSVGSTFTIPASAGYAYTGSSGTLGCSYDAVTGTSCQLPSLASGARTDFTVTLTALAAGSYSTSYTISTTQPDPNLGNNTRVQVITVN
ncbi:MAG TPA: DUF11 domain-containing protein [Gemmatimonadales bacterium]|nr:DUF11 domain-containing protein [Gemmatimonadales bacterium]